MNQEQIERIAWNNQGPPAQEIIDEIIVDEICERANELGFRELYVR